MSNDKPSATNHSGSTYGGNQFPDVEQPQPVGRPISQPFGEYQPDAGAGHPYYGDKQQYPPLPADQHAGRHFAPVQAARRAGKTSRAKWIIPAGIALLALLLGVAIGASGRPAPVVETVEKRVEVPVEKRVEVAPQACADALDYAQQVIDSAGTTIGILSDGLEAASRLDVSGVSGMSGKIDTQTGIIKSLTPKFQSTRDTCLAATN